MHPELVKTALDCARSAFGDVGLIAVTELSSSEDAWRLLLITDAGPRTVIAQRTLGITAPDVRVLAASDDPPLILLEDHSPLI